MNSYLLQEQIRLQFTEPLELIGIYNNFVSAYV